MSIRDRISTPVLGTLALALSLGLSGCATKGDLRDVQTDLRALTAQQERVLAALEQQSRMTVDTLRSQTQELNALQGNVSQQLREISQKLNQLEALVGENSRGLALIRDQLVALERSRGGVPIGPGGVSDPAAGAAGNAESAQAMFNAANQQYNLGSTTAARIGFEQFLTQYPNHELAPVAHYRLADMLVQAGELEAAIERFQRIPQQFPEDRLTVPDAYYRMGLAYAELGQEAEARRMFDIVINTYPDSASADLARERLRELGG